jgi:hypothetical protein
MSDEPRSLYEGFLFGMSLPVAVLAALAVICNRS